MSRSRTSPASTRCPPSSYRRWSTVRPRGIDRLGDSGSILNRRGSSREQYSQAVPMLEMRQLDPLENYQPSIERHERQRDWLRLVQGVLETPHPPDERAEEGAER